jgi:histidine ammonia-lyase
MIAQYAAAALVNEIKVLAHPASIDSIPTSAGMEDFVSMGATAALKLRQALGLAYRVIAIELIAAAQGLEFRKPLRPGRGALAAYERVRELVPALAEDRPPSPDIERLAAALRDGLLDDLAPEAALAEELGAVDVAGSHPAANGHRTRAASGKRKASADRSGRARH